jgi:ribosomal protein S18 acetylase RimI-like enzyme
LEFGVWTTALLEVAIDLFRFGEKTTGIGRWWLHHNCVSAIDIDEELDNTSLTDIKFRTCVSKYGIIKGTLKYVVLAAIFYRKPDKKSQLLMDGIAVKEGNRGRGIGKQLFIELEKFSIQNKMTSIKLDVIDENPKAKKLYESIGFVPTKYNKTPNFIYKLIGVRGVTTMVKEL